MILSPAPFWLQAGIAVTLLAYIWLLWVTAQQSARMIRVAMVLVWGLHGATVFSSMLISPARFGFAPALSFMAWWMLTVYVIESRFYPQIRVRWWVAALGVASVLLAQLWPGGLITHTGMAWQAFHGALGTAASGLVLAAVVHALVLDRAERHLRIALPEANHLPLMTQERLTFLFAAAGFLLLTLAFGAGLIYGVWAWDHKRILSLLAWLCFAVLLAGRLYWGWRGKLARRLLYAGAVCLVLAYVGSRFVIEAVLGR
jgi:ABC-type uncharacterized transport system permease subunit